MSLVTFRCVMFLLMLMLMLVFALLLLLFWGAVVFLFLLLLVGLAHLSLFCSSSLHDSQPCSLQLSEPAG